MEGHLMAAAAEEAVVVEVEEVVHLVEVVAAEGPPAGNHPVHLAVVVAVVGAVNLAFVAWIKMHYVAKWISWPKLLVNVLKDVISGTLRTPIK